MNANRIVLSVTACVISLYLFGWGFASSAAAATIVVTTTDDIVDPPFNASGLCGSGGTVADLPRAGGTVSLREAIIAANNTPGAKTIKFASSLNGGAIVLTGPLYLCGGHTTLNGDVNGDETPDVTVNGQAVASSSVIEVVSSHNTVKNLRVLAPHIHGVAGIEVSPNPAVSTTLMDNTLSHNIVTDGAIFVQAGYDVNGHSFNGGATVKHTIVRDNTVLSTLTFDIYVAIVGDHHEITDLTIAGNTLSGTNIGIGVFGGVINDGDPTDDGATDNRLDVTIKDNLVTGNSNPGDVAGIAILGGQDSSSHNQVSAQLLNNTVTDNTGIGILAVAGAFGGSDNQIELTMRNNLVTRNSNPGDTAGIAILGGSSSSSHNQVSAQLLNNTIADNTGRGISATVGVFGGSDNQIEVTMRDNLITGNSIPGDTAGIAVLGGFASSDNHVTASLLDNTISDNIGHGISAISALDNSSNNDVDVTIRDNTLEKNAGVGILTYGALGAFSFPSGDSSGNSLNARIERNTVKNASLFGLWVFGGLGSFGSDETNVANGNEVHAIVTDNTITGTAGDGMNLEAGSSGEANDNEVEVSVEKNTVCGSTEADIHAIGGLSSLVFPFFPDNTGTGNTLEGEITKNTADTVVVENGVAGNVATVTQFDNVPCP